MLYIKCILNIKIASFFFVLNESLKIAKKNKNNLKIKMHQNFKSKDQNSKKKKNTSRVNVKQ